LNVSSQTQVTYTEERVFGSITTLTCDNGYSFVQEEFHQQSSVSMECQYGGDWDKSRVPNCMSKIFVQISIYCDLCFIRAKSSIMSEVYFIKMVDPEKKIIGIICPWNEYIQITFALSCIPFPFLLFFLTLYIPV
jgi:hypothetical protein